jgi:hypothetical protein
LDRGVDCSPLSSGKEEFYGTNDQGDTDNGHADANAGLCPFT